MAAGCGSCVHYPARWNPCSFSVYSDFLFHLNSRRESYYNIFLTSVWSISDLKSLFRAARLSKDPCPASSGSCWSAQSDPPASGLFWTRLKCSVLFCGILSWSSLAEGWWLLKQFPCVVPAPLGQQQRLYCCRGRGDFVGGSIWGLVGKWTCYLPNSLHISDI